MKELLIRSLPFFLVAGAIFYISSLPSPDRPELGFAGEDKVLHAAAYFLLTLTARPLAGAVARQRSDRTKGWIAFGAAALFGVTDEIHQLSVEGRSAEVFDWLADCTGALLALLLIFRFGPILQRWYRRQVIRTEGS